MLDDILDLAKGAASAVGEIASTAKPYVDLGLGLYSGYSAYQNANTANDYYKNAAASAELQDKFATETYNRERPLMEAQTQAALSDTNRYMAPQFSDYRMAIDDAAYQNSLLQNQMSNTGLRYLNAAIPTLGLAGQQQASNQLTSEQLNAMMLEKAGQYVPGLADSSYQLQGVMNNEALANAQTLLPMMRNVEAGGLSNAARQNELQSWMLAAGQHYMPGIVDQQYRLAQENNQMLMDEQDTLRNLRRSQYDTQIADVNDYNQNRAGIQSYMDKSLKGLDPRSAMSRADANVERAFAGADANMVRDMSRRGVSLGSGQAMDNNRQNLIDKALARSAARSKAWMDTDKENYARAGNAVNIQKGLAPAGLASGSAMMPNTNFGSSGFSGTGTRANAGISGGIPNISATGVPTSSSTSAPMAAGGVTSSNAASMLNSSGNAWSNLANAAATSANNNAQSAGYLLNSWMK